jgi:hypothetical protein
LAGIVTKARITTQRRPMRCSAAAGRTDTSGALPSPKGAAAPACRFSPLQRQG